MTNYNECVDHLVTTMKANPNATNSELDAKVIIKHPQLTSIQLNELLSQWVEIVVDGMDTKTLYQYAYDSIMDSYEQSSQYEIKQEIDNFDEELFNELSENILISDLMKEVQS